MPPAIRIRLIVHALKKIALQLHAPPLHILVCSGECIRCQYLNNNLYFFQTSSYFLFSINLVRDLIKRRSSQHRLSHGTRCKFSTLYLILYCKTFSGYVHSAHITMHSSYMSPYVFSQTLCPIVAISSYFLLNFNRVGIPLLKQTGNRKVKRFSTELKYCF